MALEAFLGLLHLKYEEVFQELIHSPFTLYHFQQFARNIGTRSLGLGDTAPLELMLFRIGQLVEPIPKGDGLSGTRDNVSGATGQIL